MQDKSESSNLTFGARLKKAREAVDLTQVELAQQWDYDPNYIWMLESGTRPFPKKLEHKVVELESQARTIDEIVAHGPPPDLSSQRVDISHLKAFWKNATNEKLEENLRYGLDALKLCDPSERVLVLENMEFYLRYLLRRERDKEMLEKLKSGPPETTGQPALKIGKNQVTPDIAIAADLGQTLAAEIAGQKESAPSRKVVSTSGSKSSPGEHTEPRRRSPSEVPAQAQVESEREHDAKKS